MALEECMPMDLFGGDEAIEGYRLISSCNEEKGHVYESKYVLETLREVNDDTLSRVLSLDISMPEDTRGLSSDTSSKSPSNELTKSDEEVTLCADSSHVESVMSECISDGIEATDIGSLLEQFLEYEKAISPALSPAVSAFPTPVPSPGNEVELVEECIMTDMMGQPLISNNLGLEEQKICPSPSIEKQDDSGDTKEETLIEILDLEIAVDNQVTISTSSEGETAEDPKSNENTQNSTPETNSEETIENNNETNNATSKKSKYTVRSRNGVVVVECSDQSLESVSVNENEIDDEEDKDTKTKLKSVIIEKAYKIPKRQKSSKIRARSRSPIVSSSQRSFQSGNNSLLTRGDRSKSRGYSTNSDDDEREERYERYRSERRTPARKDDKRKRRKYSSCSDDEYDYYRYSKKRSGNHPERRNHHQSPVRRNNEHDYYKTSNRNHDRYQRSNSERGNGIKSRNSSRDSRPRSHHNEVNDDDNVHERLTELAVPVPYDIERERKIGFLCQGKGDRASLERRNVYAGGINRRVSKIDLVRRFEIFGPIEKVTLHFREKGDSYAFIVFEDPKDAVRAVKEGNDDPNYDRLDLCFGGRRKFVGGSYVDFDANTSYLEENDIASSRPLSPAEDESEFDQLLKMARKQQT